MDHKSQSMADRAEEVAAKLNAPIAKDVLIHLWSVPLIEALVKHIESLDKRLLQLEYPISKD